MLDGRSESCSSLTVYWPTPNHPWRSSHASCTSTESFMLREWIMAVNTRHSSVDFCFPLNAHLWLMSWQTARHSAVGRKLYAGMLKAFWKRHECVLFVKEPRHSTLELLMTTQVDNGFLDSVWKWFNKHSFDVIFKVHCKTTQVRQWSWVREATC